MLNRVVNNTCLILLFLFLLLSRISGARAIVKYMAVTIGLSYALFLLHGQRLEECITDVKDFFPRIHWATANAKEVYYYLRLVERLLFLAFVHLPCVSNIKNPIAGETRKSCSQLGLATAFIEPLKLNLFFSVLDLSDKGRAVLVPLTLSRFYCC